MSFMNDYSATCYIFCSYLEFFCMSSFVFLHESEQKGGRGMNVVKPLPFKKKNSH